MTASVEVSGETLGAFLRTCRDRMTPEALGLSSYGTTRRVPGLRREELAQLAGLSAGYYTRLEQGQAGRASSQVLDALARVLRLDDVETAHLHNLARGPAISRLEAPDEEEPDSHVLALLHALGESVPAVLLGRRGDVLAWSRTGHALLAPHLDDDAPRDPDTRPSIPRMFFLDPVHRSLYRNWDELAHPCGLPASDRGGCIPRMPAWPASSGSLPCAAGPSPGCGPPARSPTAPLVPWTWTTRMSAVWMSTTRSGSNRIAPITVSRCTRLETTPHARCSVSSPPEPPPNPV